MSKYTYDKVIEIINSKGYKPISSITHCSTKNLKTVGGFIWNYNKENI